jgi:DNA helicase II / ATP-dependent DNA helicase PcrA
MGLNEAQHAAATASIGQPLLIVAGPGSGKTKTMVGRVAYMLREGVTASRILAVTFTKNAAEEMRSRLFAEIGHGAKAVQIATFHALALQICRQHADTAGCVYTAIRARSSPPEPCCAVWGVGHYGWGST